jgi:Predicted membrane protein (DUF2079)
MIDKIFKANFFNHIFILLFLLLPQLQILNLRINIFDTGIYLVNLYNIIENNNYYGLVNGHFQPILYLISLILRINFNFADHIILLLQSIVLLLPYLILNLKENKNSYLYLYFFPIWLVNLNGFHVDCFIYPLLFLYLFEKEIKKKILYCLSFIIVKEIYFILTCLCILEIIFLVKEKKNQVILFMFLSFLIIITILLIVEILPKNSMQVTYLASLKLNQESSLKIFIGDFYSYLKKIDYSKISYAILIFLPTLFIPLINKKFLFFYLPFFFIYLILPNPNILKPQFHYSIVFIPLIIHFFFISKFFNAKKKVFLFINLITISLSLVNIGNINLFRNYDYKNFIYFDKKKKLDIFLSNLISNNNDVIATNNNLNHRYIYQRNILIVQDLHNADFLKSKELCKCLTLGQLDKAKKLSDKICEVSANKILFKNNYFSQLSNYEINTINVNYYILKKNDEYSLYAIKK